MSNPNDAPQISTETPVDAENTKRPKYRRAIVFSVLAHVVILVGALYWYIPRAKPSPANSTVAKAPSSKQSDIQAAPHSEARVPDDLVKSSLDQQIEQAEQLTDEEKLSELEKNLKRLDSIANPKSVKNVSEKIGSSLGLDTAAYQPKQKPAAGEFDPKSAQISDVTRHKNDRGNWVYTSTLVDSGGREMQVPVPAADGETLYTTFQQMKKFPMAAGIYRSVVMPMMQKMLEAEDLTKKAANEAQRMQREDAQDKPVYK